MARCCAAEEKCVLMHHVTMCYSCCPAVPQVLNAKLQAGLRHQAALSDSQRLLEPAQLQVNIMFGVDPGPRVVVHIHADHGNTQLWLLCMEQTVSAAHAGSVLMPCCRCADAAFVLLQLNFKTPQCFMNSARACCCCCCRATVLLLPLTQMVIVRLHC